MNILTPIFYNKFLLFILILFSTSCLQEPAKIINRSSVKFNKNNQFNQDKYRNIVQKKADKKDISSEKELTKDAVIVQQGETLYSIAKKNGVQIQPAGAHAANLAGLSEQVPGRLIFLTEGPSRKVKIGNQEIIFKKSTSTIMSSAGTREGLIIQAFKNLGKDHIDKVVRARTRKFLALSGEKEIRKNLKFAPAWLRTLVFEIMGIAI